MANSPSGHWSVALGGDFVAAFGALLEDDHLVNVLLEPELGALQELLTSWRKKKSFQSIKSNR